MSTPDLPAIARECAEKIAHRLESTDFDERGPTLNTGHAQEVILAALTEATEKAREDSERLDRGRIMLRGCVYAGQDLRQAIDDAARGAGK